MKRKWLCLLLCICLVLSGCGKKELHRYSASFMDLFNTVTMVVGAAEDEEAFRAMSQEIRDKLEVYHQLYDVYNTYEGMNNLKTINDLAGVEPVKVEKPILDLLLFCRDMYEKTGGLVDVTMGGMLAIWHDARTNGIDFPEDAYLPDENALWEAAQHAGFDRVIIDEENSTVFITDEKLQLDVGAIGKGYAVEQVAKTLPDGVLLSVGGNVRGTGKNPLTGAFWTAGVQNPVDVYGEYLHVLNVDGVSVVTSGDYQRYYMVDGVRYGHIIDPRTMQPPRLWNAVCILAPDSGVADALSTALYMLPVEEGQKLLDLFDAEAMWMGADGEYVYSPGFKNYIK